MFPGTMAVMPGSDESLINRSPDQHCGVEAAITAVVRNLGGDVVSPEADDMLSAGVVWHGGPTECQVAAAALGRLDDVAVIDGGSYLELLCRDVPVRLWRRLIRQQIVAIWLAHHDEPGTPKDRASRVARHVGEITDETTNTAAVLLCDRIGLNPTHLERPYDEALVLSLTVPADTAHGLLAAAQHLTRTAAGSLRSTPTSCSSAQAGVYDGLRNNRMFARDRPNEA
jgi:hypothetical protein